MNYKQLTSEYFVLAPIERNNEQVLLCRSIKHFFYDFFVQKNGDYVAVDNNTELELRQIYKSSPSALFKIYLSKKSKQYTNLINQQYALAKKHIEKLIENTDILTRSLVRSRLENLSFRHYSEMQGIEEEVDPDICPAFYHANSNTYYYSDEDTLADIALTMHELLHGASSAPDGSSNGFMLYSQYQDQKTKQLLNFESGRGLSEGATEFYSSLALHKVPDSYDILVHIYDCLRQACRNVFVDTFYFSNKPKNFATHISNSFHYDNNYQIEKLIAQMDAHYAISEVSSLSRDKKSADFLSINLECYKTLIDMFVHKYNYEKVSLDDKYLFDNFLPLGNMDEATKGYYQKKLQPALELYFSMKMYCEKQDTQNEVSDQDIEAIILKLMPYMLDKKNIPPQAIPEEIKTPKFYQKLFSVWQSYSKNFEETTPTTKYKLYKTLFSAKCLPKDRAMQLQIVDMAMKSTDFYYAFVYMYFPKNLIVEYLNKNPKYAVLCVQENPTYFVENIISNLSSKIKQDPTFRKTVISTLKKLEPEKRNQIIEKYYNSLTKELKLNREIIKELESVTDETTNASFIQRIQDPEIYIDEITQ